MNKYKKLSGGDTVKILESYGFILKRTKGSHARLSLILNNDSFHITIPLHAILKTGTLHNIVKDFEICFGKSEAEKHFYN
jgi:predicted RNA binding protein YcfA (HicA-like mRNA interferase family)